MTTMADCLPTIVAPAVAAMPGTRVWVPGLEEWAICRSLNIAYAGTTYEVAWFSNGDRKTAWLYADEFSRVKS